MRDRRRHGGAEVGRRGLVARRPASPIIEGYGLSETSPVLTCNRGDITEWTGTIGLPVPSTEISIRDDDDHEVPLGEHGEICARGPQVMPGYWQRPDETAKVMTADGFFRTGDIGVMDEQGRVKIVDRKKDMISVSGFKVFPNEVEDVAMMQGGVLECAAVGVPDAHSGEAVKLFAVKKSPDLTEQDLRSYHARPARRLQGAEAYRVPRRAAEDQCRQDPAPRAAGRAHERSARRCRRPPTWSRSGARPGRSAGSRRTPLSTTTSAGASSKLHEAAAAGKLTAWEANAEGALALLILLDQFPRNMFRGQARAFASDPLARAIASRAILNGFDGAVSRPARLFLSAVRAFGKSRRPGTRRSRSIRRSTTPTA